MPRREETKAGPAQAEQKVALVCDWLTTPGGAEKVLLQLHHMYPDAPIYTSQYDPQGIDWFADATVRTGWLQHFPSKLRKFLGPLRQLYFSHLDLSDYDLVISVTGAEAKSVKTAKIPKSPQENTLSSHYSTGSEKSQYHRARHLCYCHVPTQYYWQMYDQYCENPGFGVLNPLVRFAFKLLVKPLRRADFRAAQQPDQFVTISEYAAEQIQKYYHRDAVVVAPPVEVGKFAPKPVQKLKLAPKSKTLQEPNATQETASVEAASGYIIACRQVTWKRVDLAIEACLAAQAPLLVVGDGPEHANLVKLAHDSPLIKFLPWLQSDELAAHLQGAKAYLFPSLEPFGIAAVEALAAGCPVIAYQAGGSRDFVLPGKNGLLFAEQTPASLAAAIRQFEQQKHPFDRARVAQTAQKFAPARFVSAMRALAQKVSHVAQPSTAKLSPTKPSPTKPSTAKHLSQNPASAANLACGKLAKALRGCFYLLPAVIFFSYYPIISLGRNSSMNFELSLPLIWLVIFDLLSFAVLIQLAVQTRRANAREAAQVHARGKWYRLSQAPNFPGLSDRKIFLLSLFPFWATLSIFWSANPVRAILTAGIIWLLFFAVFSIVALLPLATGDSKRQGRRLITVFLIASVAVSLFCWLQAILDTIGLPRTDTLLCAGCTYRSFGFPHPSGFAIEPQFMGNLLLAPALLSLFILAWRRPAVPQRRLWLLALAALIILTTLFFTFSRGAIYAFAVALAILIVFALAQRRFRWSLVTLPVFAFLISLTAQGIFAAVGPTSETFSSAVTKSIHQLSLGIVDLRSFAQPSAAPPAAQPSTSQSPAGDQAPADAPHFDGYVAESTNVRLHLNDLAFRTWLSYPGRGLVHLGNLGVSPRTILVGVGLGGAGTAMYEFAPDEIGSPKEIVQNQPFSLLLETGLIGLALAVFGIIIAFCYQTDLLGARRTSQSPARSQAALAQQARQGFISLRRHAALPLLVALVSAYLISLNFFAGLPNALHIYLLPPFIYCIYLRYEI